MCKKKKTKCVILCLLCKMSQGGKEYLMRAHFGLPSVEAEDKEGKPPISVKFEIPYFTTSGIQVGHIHTGSNMFLYASNKDILFSACKFLKVNSQEHYHTVLLVIFYD